MNKRQGKEHSTSGFRSRLKTSELKLSNMSAPRPCGLRFWPTNKGGLGGGGEGAGSLIHHWK